MANEEFKTIGDIKNAVIELKEELDSGKSMLVSKRPYKISALPY